MESKSTGLTCRCMAVSPLRTAAVVVCVASINGPGAVADAAAAANTSGAAVCCCKMEIKKTSALNIHPMQQISIIVTSSRLGLSYGHTVEIWYFDNVWNGKRVAIKVILRLLLEHFTLPLDR